MKFNFLLYLCTFLPMVLSAQNLQLRGVKNSMRYNDGEDTKYEYVGWDSATGTAIFKGDVGLWQLQLDGNQLNAELVQYDNLMYGNSGSVHIGDHIYTVMSHEDPDATESSKMEFVVRKWKADTYELLSSQRFPASANIESRGMAFNPVDKQVYGLFYLTDVELPVPEEELDQEDRDEGLTHDAGYALCTIDLNTMELHQITPGIYYDNFVTLACSPTGRLFSLTSGGSLVEFDAASGLIIDTKSIGVKSQFKRQAACFDYNTGRMYWNGYINNGMGYNEWGSYGPLSDKEWRTNGKYDTALYEVDLETGAATQLSLIPNRIAFSCLWVVGGDASEIVSIEQIANESAASSTTYYNLQGQPTRTQHGLFINPITRQKTIIF